VRGEIAKVWLFEIRNPKFRRGIAVVLAWPRPLRERRAKVACQPKLAAHGPPSLKASAGSFAPASRAKGESGLPAEARGTRPAFAEGFGGQPCARFASEGWCPWPVSKKNHNHL
jgi:hypothetical protein